MAVTLLQVDIYRKLEKGKWRGCYGICGCKGFLIFISNGLRQFMGKVSCWWLYGLYICKLNPHKLSLHFAKHLGIWGLPALISISEHPYLKVLSWGICYHFIWQSQSTTSLACISLFILFNFLILYFEHWRSEGSPKIILDIQMWVTSHWLRLSGATRAGWGNCPCNSPRSLRELLKEGCEVLALQPSR